VRNAHIAQAHVTGASHRAGGEAAAFGQYAVCTHTHLNTHIAHHYRAVKARCMRCSGVNNNNINIINMCAPASSHTHRSKNTKLLVEGGARIIIITHHRMHAHQMQRKRLRNCCRVELTSLPGLGAAAAGCYAKVLQFLMEKQSLSLL
jgi:hypothetical protein